MGRSVRRPVHTVNGRISGDSDNEAMHALLGYSNRSGQRPRQYVHPGTDCSRIRQTESRGVELGRKRHSIDLRDSDRGVTSFEVCVHEVECHLAIAGVLSHGLTAGVPWLLGRCGKETLRLGGEQGILMVEWSEVGV